MQKLTIAKNFQYTVSVCLNKLVYCILLFILVVPPPSMSVALTPSGTIYESTLLVITCNATLPSVVDTVVSATVTWTGPSGTINGDERITVGQTALIVNNIFQSELKFSPVDNGDEFGKSNQDDDGVYTCRMDISQSSSNDLILNGLNNINEEVSVEGRFFIYYISKAI